MAVSLHTWHDVEGLLGKPETRELDFKGQLGPSEKIAKAIAAMTDNGGTVVYGLVEDKQTGLAARIEAIESLSRAEERISQIVGSSIDPVPTLEIKAIQDPGHPGRGVIVVEVQRSSDGPHMANGHYPTRTGTTIRPLTNAEVAARLQANAGAARPAPKPAPPKPSELLEDASLLPGISPDRVRSVHAGYGQLRIGARPRDQDLEHPRSPQMKKVLAGAAALAQTRAHERLAIYNPPLVLAKLVEWRPEGTTGWVSGSAGHSAQRLETTPTVAAVMAYPWRTTVQVTIPTTVEAHRHAPAYRCVHEGYLASQLWATLVYLGELYSDVEPTLLDVAAQVAGFNGAVSYHASHATEGLRVDHLPTATHGYAKTLSVWSDQLLRAPEDVARDLIERWLISFYEGDDLFAHILVPADHGVPLA